MPTRRTCGASASGRAWPSSRVRRTTPRLSPSRRACTAIRSGPRSPASSGEILPFKPDRANDQARERRLRLLRRRAPSHRGHAPRPRNRRADGQVRRSNLCVALLARPRLVDGRETDSAAGHVSAADGDTAVHRGCPRFPALPAGSGQGMARPSPHQPRLLHAPLPLRALAGRAPFLVLGTRVRPR